MSSCSLSTVVPKMTLVNVHDKQNYPFPFLFSHHHFHLVVFYYFPYLCHHGGVYLILSIYSDLGLFFGTQSLPNFSSTR